MNNEKLYNRIVAKVRKDPFMGCWLWTGPYYAKRPYPGNRYGYVALTRPGRGRSTSVSAHRAMWIALHGEIPDTVYICHRCDIPLCVNPEHLFAGAAKDNTQDMIAKNRHNNGKKTICKRGHPLDDDNVTIKPDGARECKICATGRYRVRAGWPEALAFSIPPLPMGFRMNFETGVASMQPPTRKKRV